MHLYDFIDRSCWYYNFTIKSLRSSKRKAITNASYNNLFCAPWRRHGRRNWSDGMKNIIVSSMKYNWNVYIYQLTDQIIFHECIFHIILSDTKLSYYKTIQTQSSIEISFQRLIQSSSTCLHPREHDAPYQKRILFVSVIRSWNAFDISTITHDRFEAWNRHVGDIETTFEPIAVAIVQAHILRRLIWNFTYENRMLELIETSGWHAIPSHIVLVASDRSISGHSFAYRPLERKYSRMQHFVKLHESSSCSRLDRHS